MKVFLSWSGPASRSIAEALHHWLPRVIQSITPWMSAEDIAKGARWSSELANQLQSTRFGIICVTPDNTNAAWLLFEAGALSKTTEATFVCPYLFNVQSVELTGPLTEFQHSTADRDGTRRLVQTINMALPETAALREKQLDETFEIWWPQLEAKLKRIATTATVERQPIRTDHDILIEVLELIRAMTRRSSAEVFDGSTQLFSADLLRSLKEAKTLLRSDKESQVSTQRIVGELAEQLPAILQRSARKSKKLRSIK